MVDQLQSMDLLSRGRHAPPTFMLVGQKRYYRYMKTGEVVRSDGKLFRHVSKIDRAHNMHKCQGYSFLPEVGCLRMISEGDCTHFVARVDCNTILQVHTLGHQEHC